MNNNTKKEESKNVLITGANRGIGLALSQKFLHEGYMVFAAMRHPGGARDAWELEAEYPGRLHLVEMDVTSQASVQKATDTIASHLPAKEGLRFLINNAGVLPGGGQSFLEVDEESMVKAFSVNVMGTIRVSQAVLPFLEKDLNPVIANMSSKVGSISDNHTGGMFAYRTSKTALNMVTKNMSLQLNGITVVALHPGWVKTDMGGHNAPTEVFDSASGLFRLLQDLTEQSNGDFVDFRGERIPW